MKKWKYPYLPEVIQAEGTLDDAWRREHCTGKIVNMDQFKWQKYSISMVEWFRNFMSKCTNGWRRMGPSRHHENQAMVKITKVGSVWRNLRHQRLTRSHSRKGTLTYLRSNWESWKVSGQKRKEALKPIPWVGSVKSNKIPPGIWNLDIQMKAKPM